MIVGTGIDIVEVERIKELYERYGEKFLRRFLREDELIPAEGDRFFQFLAGRWAAKEAFWKAANCRRIFSPLSLRISSGNKPVIEIYSNMVKERVTKEMGVKRIHLTISHERRYAVAMVIMEGGIE